MKTKKERKLRFSDHIKDKFFKHTCTFSKSNLEKYVGNAIHCHVDQLQPIPAKEAAGTYPAQGS